MIEPVNELVEIKNLTINFATIQGTVRALDDVNLVVRKGEVLGLVGETGCGKTVTSRSIMALFPANASIVSGAIRLGSTENVLALDAKRLQSLRGSDVAMIFQDASRSLNPIMRVGEQISEALLLHRREEIVNDALHLLETKYQNDRRRRLTERLLKRSVSSPNSKILSLLRRIPYVRLFQRLLEVVTRERCVKLLQLVQIALPERRVDEYPHQLSGGMRQRAMIAMALACNPKLLIADEPTTSQDVTTEYHILKLIKNLRDEFDMTVIIVTHNFGVVANLCDRVAVMYAGSIAEVAPAQSILNNPLHPYTQGLLNAIHEIGDVKEPKSIPGFIPDLINPPTGCRFHPRCPLAEDVCRREVPKPLEVEQGHLVACFPVQRQYAVYQMSET